MNEERFSIGELAAAAATTPRTIRFYTAEGLPPQPLTEGRNAIYMDGHRRRLRLIQRLKAAYLPLSAIKEQMSGLTDVQVNSLLERGGPHRVENTPVPPAPRTRAAATMPAEASAMEYVAQILAVAEQSVAVEPTGEGFVHSKRILIMSPALHVDGDSSSVSNRQSELVEGRPERWARIVLQPGIELHLREPLTQARRAQINQLIRIARKLFAESAP